MKLIKKSPERWESENEKYRAIPTHYGVVSLKYYVSGCGQFSYASTLKEAAEIMDQWEEEAAIPF